MVISEADVHLTGISNELMHGEPFIANGRVSAPWLSSAGEDKPPPPQEMSAPNFYRARFGFLASSGSAFSSFQKFPSQVTTKTGPVPPNDVLINLRAPRTMTILSLDLQQLWRDARFHC
jgi:hypothetical protein